jgi:hypothetical protein
MKRTLAKKASLLAFGSKSLFVIFYPLALCPHEWQTNRLPVYNAGHHQFVRLKKLIAPGRDGH